MPVFHLNIREGGVLRLDFEGQNFPSLEAARMEAVAGAREILADHIISGAPVTAASIEITDVGGTVLDSILMSNVVQSDPIASSPKFPRS